MRERERQRKREREREREKERKRKDNHNLVKKSFKLGDKARGNKCYYILLRREKESK